MENIDFIKLIQYLLGFYFSTITLKENTFVTSSFTAIKYHFTGELCHK